MAFETNRFCWHGCTSTNVEVSKAFYSKVIGWEVQTTPMGDSEATFFRVGADKIFAHLSPPEMDGVPSHWSSFLRVDNVDASTTSAVKNGGHEIMPPMDIPPGRFSVISTPSGASMVLFHEADPTDSHHHETAPGLVHWVELHSKDIDTDIAWLKKTFGFDISEMQMPNGPYYILKNGDQPRGGVMASQSDDAPAMWLVWINVSNVDETLASAESNNGKVLSPIFEVPGVGRMAVMQDPTGGVLGVITPEA